MNVVVSWSGGKDSSWTYYRAWNHGGYKIHGLLTTITESYNRISIHGVRRDILHRQAHAIGLPVFEVPIPPNCPNEIYEQRMQSRLSELKEKGIDAIIFGDIFLEDVREYRERLLYPTGMKGLFLLWGEKTDALAREMIACGLQAWTTCVDGDRLGREWVGREFSYDFLMELPEHIDPCGENGEFHTLVTDAPFFSEAIPVKKGEVILLDRRFWYCDFILQQDE